MIEFRNLTKIFGAHKALSQVSLSIQANEIHSIVGENGAGKSTLLKILCGLHQPTSGQMFLKGETFAPVNAQEAFHKKIVMIHQHFMLGGQLTAFENILLSQTSSDFSGRAIDQKKFRNEIEAQLKTLNWTLSLDQAVEKLSVGDQQRIEILKALLAKPEVLILDEPTAVLTPIETEELLSFILKLKQQGLTIILVTHKLHEVMKVSDRISVLRRGEYIKTLDRKNATEDLISEAMIGRKLHKSVSNKNLGEEILCSVNLSDLAVKKPASTATTSAAISSTAQNQINSLDLRKGEIFGIAGVEGNGQSELIARVLQTLREKGYTYGDITEDRLHLGCFPELNLVEHILVKGPHEQSRPGWLQTKSALKLTEQIIQEWDVRPGDPWQNMATLSGGNQQKFVVGLELAKLKFVQTPQVLVAAHPTRGVDLGAIAFIHQKIKQFAAEGGTVLLVSSELEEVLQLSDRYGILFSQNLKGPFVTDQLTEAQIGCYMTLGRLRHEQDAQT